MSKEELLSRMEKAIVEGDKNMAENLARDAIKKHMDLNEIIEKGYVPGIQEKKEQKFSIRFDFTL